MYKRPDPDIVMALLQTKMTQIELLCFSIRKFKDQLHVEFDKINKCPITCQRSFFLAARVAIAEAISPFLDVRVHCPVEARLISKKWRADYGGRMACTYPRNSLWARTTGIANLGGFVLR